MRHLNTEELLLYAAAELDDPALCRHVRDCVDCKASLVEAQETLVGAVAAVRASVPAEPAAMQTASLMRLRANIAAETEKVGCCLTAGELLLSSEVRLPADRAAHLDACSKCQREAANMSILLADIEAELRSLIADEPVEIKTAALAALDRRLAEQAQQPATPPRQPAKVLAFPVARVREYAAVAAAAAFVVWAGFQAVRQPELAPDAMLTASSVPATAVTGPDQPAPPTPAALPRADETVAATRPAPTAAPPTDTARFELAASAPTAPLRETVAANVPAPPAAEGAPQTALLAWAAPDLQPYRAVETASATPASAARPVPVMAEMSESAIEGYWLLARTGLWKQDIRPAGSGGNIVFTGSVADAPQRAAAESKLRAAAGERSLTFDLALRDDDRGAGQTVILARNADRPAGGMARNALLSHYRDAARRSFRSPRMELLEAELERYVSDVLRHDSELLAHVHAVHSVLSRADVAALGETDTLRRLLAFHLDGIANREQAIYARLSEVLPRRYWTYRGPKTVPAEPLEAAAESTALLEDALELDETLTAIFVSGQSALDARGNERSCGERLAGIRSRVARLRRVMR